MAVVMHIGFDNPRRLKRNVYYFAYKGVRFKLLQGHALNRDVLMTEVPADDAVAVQSAFSAAGEFLSALSWANGSRIAFDYVGNLGGEHLTLRRANTRWTGPARVPFQGYATGFDIEPIPAIKTAEQGLALAMLREGFAANNTLLSFLLYWQVMEINSSSNAAANWVTKTWIRPRSDFIVPRDDIKHLPLNGRKLGDYLLNDCRDAIAHIRRTEGRRPLRFDNLEEVARMEYSARVASRFAHEYVVQKLRLTEDLWLVRRYGRGFPEYVEEQVLRSDSQFQPAYDRSRHIRRQPPFRQRLRRRKPALR
jgi:hypothetical protein